MYWFSVPFYTEHSSGICPYYMPSEVWITMLFLRYGETAHCNHQNWENHAKGNNGNIKTNMEADLAQGNSQLFGKLKWT